MTKEEAELLPSGLVSCLLNNKEVRILKISPDKLTLRLAEKISNILEIKVAFHIFDEYRYKEIIINQYIITNVIEEEFYFIYVLSIKDMEYSKNVKNIFKNYSKYIMLKTNSEDNEFSQEMVGYPAEQDYEFPEDYNKQKKEWLCDLNYERYNMNIMNNVELAITLDNDILYSKYLEKKIKAFESYYLKENFVNNHILFKKDINRLYIGNQFCHNLFPKMHILMNMLMKAKEEKLYITLCFTYMRECYIEKIKEIIDKVYNWCKENNTKIEIVVNDWGMIRLLHNKNDYFSLSLGVLLNKRKKDPRYIYKKGYIENENLMAENTLNNSSFNKFLKEQCNIKRYEYENCRYKISIADGHNSIHVPFYVTNTSQYCPLYAMCENMDRGNQKLVTNCPKYCNDYVFAYPKHLKMVGRYNSLFAFDDTLLKKPKVLEYYINSGIDRIVLNFI